MRWQVLRWNIEFDHIFCLPRFYTPASQFIYALCRNVKGWFHNLLFVRGIADSSRQPSSLSDTLTQVCIRRTCCAHAVCSLTVCLLTEGRMEVTKDGERLQTMEPEDVFGELALLYNCTHTSSVSGTKAVFFSPSWFLFFCMQVSLSLQNNSGGVFTVITLELFGTRIILVWESIRSRRISGSRLGQKTSVEFKTRPFDILDNSTASNVFSRRFGELKHFLLSCANAAVRMPHVLPAIQH